MKPDYETLISQVIFLPRAKSRFKPSIFLSKCKRALTLYRRNIATRRQLELLSIDQLRDAGITSERAELESTKYFWKK